MATRDEWAERVRRWRASGLTAKDFAGREKLQPATLRWWASALERKARTKPFVEVTLSAPVTGSIAVVLPNGMRIEINGAFDEGVLRRVVAALEAR